MTVFVGRPVDGRRLALRLAEQHGSEVAGLLLVNPSVASADRRLVADPVAQTGSSRSANGITSDIKKPGQREDGYDRVPLRALDSLRAMWR